MDAKEHDHKHARWHAHRDASFHSNKHHHKHWRRRRRKNKLLSGLGDLSDLGAEEIPKVISAIGDTTAKVIGAIKNPAQSQQPQSPFDLKDVVVGAGLIAGGFFMYNKFLKKGKR